MRSRLSVRGSPCESFVSNNSSATRCATFLLDRNFAATLVGKFKYNAEAIGTVKYSANVSNISLKLDGLDAQTVLQHIASARKIVQGLEIVSQEIHVPLGKLIVLVLQAPSTIAK